MPCVGVTGGVQAARPQLSKHRIDVVRHHRDHGADSAIRAAEEDEVAFPGEHAEHRMRGCRVISLDVLEVEDLRVELERAASRLQRICGMMAIPRF